MPRLLSTVVLVLLCGLAPLGAWPDSNDTAPSSGLDASAAGALHGTVLDESGAAISGARVLVAGVTVASVRTDAQGRFTFALPPGDYSVGATSTGYLSMPSAVVHVGPNATVERRITLRRAAVAVAVAAPIDAASSTPDPAPADGSSASHSEIAWRLRHLPRTVLREETPLDLPAPSGGAWQPDASAAAFAQDHAPRPLSTLFASADLSGQLNLLTMSSLMADAGAAAARPTGVADLAFGAPVGSIGDWSVRGAMSAGTAASWTFVGEYQARETERHAMHVSLAYSTQREVTGASLDAGDEQARSVGSLRVADRWKPSGRLELDYAARLDRYDYLVDPTLVGGHLALRARLVGATRLSAEVSDAALAPGADQFLPPAVSGIWLPPVRTFSSLVSWRPLVPEEVQSAAAGIEHAFATRGAPVVRAEWFREATANQLAAVFGVDDASRAGHYYIASPGSVDVSGWRLHAGARFGPHVGASVDYLNGEASWSGTDAQRALRRLAAPVARTGGERVAALRSSIDVAVPATSTHVAFTYRTSRAAPPPADAAIPLAYGRFSLEVRQLLPYHPLGSGEWNVVMSVRTLLYETEGSAIYDELLTSRPPARATGGLEMKF